MRSTPQATRRSATKSPTVLTRAPDLYRNVSARRKLPRSGPSRAEMQEVVQLERRRISTVLAARGPYCCIRIRLTGAIRSPRIDRRVSAARVDTALDAA